MEDGAEATEILAEGGRESVMSERMERNKVDSGQQLGQELEGSLDACLSPLSICYQLKMVGIQFYWQDTRLCSKISSKQNTRHHVSRDHMQASSRMSSTTTMYSSNGKQAVCAGMLRSGCKKRHSDGQKRGL